MEKTKKKRKRRKLLRKNAEKILSVRIQLSESVRIRNLSIEVDKWIRCGGEYDLLGSEGE